MKQFEVKVGHVYKTKTENSSPFLPGDVLKIYSINDGEAQYRYLSDNWETSKEIDKFTDQYLELPTKLEMYLYGATNVEMD